MARCAITAFEPPLVTRSASGMLEAAERPREKAAETGAPGACQRTAAGASASSQCDCAPRWRVRSASASQATAPKSPIASACIRRDRPAIARPPDSNSVSRGESAISCQSCLVSTPP